MREMAHEFAEKEIRPVAWDYDRDGTWPGEILEKAWELGLMNNHLPSEYGRPALGFLDGCIIEEEIAWGCSGIGTSLSCNGLATAPISLGASEELKRDYLGRLSEAPLLASFCLTEPDAGSDVSGMKTTATRKGDKWVISGSKCFITNGEYANYYTVYAKTDKDAGHRGISCFIVPRDAGVVVDKHEDKMGQRASNTATITFPAIEDSKQRVQFGVPIAMHEAIQFIIADMATKVHLARLATWNSAVLLDQGKRNTLESSHAKRFAADSAMEVTTDAVQVYGDRK